jgi:hypothetical protein
MINQFFSIATIILGAVGVLGPIGAIVAAIVAPTVAIPVIVSLLKKFIGCGICVLTVAVIIACVGSYWVGHHDAYTKGVDDTVAKVARGDATLVNRALKARSKLKECQADGRRWDQTTGACR